MIKRIVFIGKNERPLSDEIQKCLQEDKKNETKNIHTLEENQFKHLFRFCPFSTTISTCYT